MSRNMSPARRRKENIRKRDRDDFEKRMVCNLCGKIARTEIHHFRYSDVYDERALLEVCSKCHKAIHGLKHAASNLPGGVII